MAQHQTGELRADQLLRTVRIAWGEDQPENDQNVNQENLNRRCTLCIHIKKAKKDLTVRIARRIFGLSAIVAFMFSIIYLLETFEGFRPHGKLILVLSTFGIIVPSVMIIGNKKMRKIATFYF